MAQLTLQQASIPDVSKLLLLKSAANQKLLDSVGTLGKVGENYNKIQSDVYNNPLLDRLRRATNKQEFNAIDSQIDPLKANSQLQALQTAGIQKYQNLDTKIQEQQLSNQFDTTDLTQLPTVKNLYDTETDSTKKLQYGNVLNKLVTNQQNFAKTKSNLQFNEQASKDILDGIQNLSYNDATTPEQLTAISIAGTKLASDNQARALASISALGTPSLLSSPVNTQNSNTDSNTELNINSKFDPNNPLPDFYDNNLLKKESGNYKNTGSIGNGRQITPAAAKDVGYSIEDINKNPALEKEASGKYNILLANAYKNKTGEYPTYRQTNLLWNQGPRGGVDLLTANPNALAIDVLTESYKGNRAKAEQALEGNLGSITDTVATYQTKLDDYYNGDLVKNTSPKEITGDITTTGTKKLVQEIQKNAQQQVQNVYAPRLAYLNSLPVTPETLAKIKEITTESRTFERQAIAEQVYKRGTTPEAQNRLLAQMGITDPKELSTIGKYLKQYISSNLTPRADAELPIEANNTLNDINADVESAQQTITGSSKTIADSEGYLKTVKTYSSLPNTQAIVNKAITDNVSSDIDPDDKLNAATNLGKTIEQLRSKLNEGSDDRLYDITDAQAVAAIESSIGYSDGGWFGSEEFVPNLDKAVAFLENNATADSKAITFEKQQFDAANNKVSKLLNAVKTVQIDIVNNNNAGLPIDNELKELGKLRTQIKNLKRTDPVLKTSIKSNERGLPNTDTQVPKTPLEQDIDKAKENKRVVDPTNTNEFKYTDPVQKIKDAVKQSNLSPTSLVKPTGRYQSTNSKRELKSFEEFKKSIVKIPTPPILLKSGSIAADRKIETRDATDTEKKDIYNYLKNMYKTEQENKINNEAIKLKQTQDEQISNQNRLNLINRAVNN